ncbi:hypothetical protein CDAR_238551 [Caerostris darwini]|uniref:Uncharacterized protein n=1 Tax=Caerostris darwini TaxID=1538125 RepID=A0AAV4TJS6_9ARAC|nr:hypothetical protein CDAR_46891 [Caerostris darwini]GIY46369.1 hypothetical protein CDAR_238551 [Caerostris darwini]
MIVESLSCVSLRATWKFFHCFPQHPAFWHAVLEPRKLSTGNQLLLGLWRQQKYTGRSTVGHVTHFMVPNNEICHSAPLLLKLPSMRTGRPLVSDNACDDTEGLSIRAVVLPVCASSSFAILYVSGQGQVWHTGFSRSKTKDVHRKICNEKVGARSEGERTKAPSVAYDMKGPR